MAHSDKASLVQFNPVAADVVATAAFDWLIKIWNLDTAQVNIRPVDQNMKPRHGTGDYSTGGLKYEAWTLHR